MVTVLVKISERANRVFNIVKAKHGLRTKAEAINYMAQKYEEVVLEPQLRPEYIETAKAIHAQKPIFVGTVQELRKRYK